MKEKSLLAISAMFSLLLYIPSINAQEKSKMLISGPTSQPIGHYEFCKKYFKECQYVGGDKGRFKLTDKRWKVLNSINHLVNVSYKSLTDQEIYGVEEKWEYPVTAADCEDFVLIKRKKLLEKGFPVSDLLITVVLKPDTQAHAVLVVRTDRGDFILDNMHDDILLWLKTEYKYIKRQSPRHPGHWQKILDNHMHQVSKK
ncbi:hypothetical protein B488_10390 [Liberibacter crescens BT-1]|uniref:Periplasmic protein n=1 Tax=Liberibacter crescens (strain BT-1) TaxID=1215343 RepID=L0EXE0_LIBCB|nr:transglutaminase-like cysteine peptidase [Liberibacter crescens]AGA65031.1 hypothetical protein B488_10390 [Liberibacter crescens BT-1]AMC13036.1 transglutaminase [Liberibacter crescens]